MVVVAVAALLIAQRIDADRRVAKLQAELKAIRVLVPDPYIVARSQMNQVKVQAAGDQVVIAAAAGIIDRRPDTAYVWWVRILDPKGKAVRFAKRYDSQAIWPRRGRELHPTFTDILRPSLPPGNYRVEVALYQIPPKTGLAGLDDPKVARSLVMMSGGEMITLESGE
jgi:hypothetical protein